MEHYEQELKRLREKWDKGWDPPEPRAGLCRALPRVRVVTPVSTYEDFQSAFKINGREYAVTKFDLSIDKNTQTQYYAGGYTEEIRTGLRNVTLELEMYDAHNEFLGGDIPYYEIEWEQTPFRYRIPKAVLSCCDVVAVAINQDVMTTVRFEGTQCEQTRLQER